MNKIQSSSSAHKWMQKDRGVWVKANNAYPNPNEDAFLQGRIIDASPQNVLVQLIQSRKQFRIPLENCQKLTYGPSDVADMVDLEELNQAELLYNIKRRYLNSMIFTYCGPTLLIINPYSFIEKLFNQTVMQEFQTLVFTQNLQYKHLAPHIFGLSAFCLWQLFDNERDQSIVISGQSGAGKTQNTKYCLKFLASLGKNMKDFVWDKKKINSRVVWNAEKAIKKTSTKLNGIEDRILGCNQILQAFGNSKTIRNDNSSRFGKLILLLYGETQIDIRSALITSYLLEKSRIVSISEGERNYHIFYYFCKGASEEERKKYLLKQPIDNYYYLNQSTVYDVKGQSDESKYQALKSQFEQYLSQEQISCVLKVISIVLNIGNLKFKKVETKDNEETAVIINEQYLQNVIDLLEVDYTKFKHNFQFKTRKLGTNIIDSPLKYDEIVALRDSFAKNIYERIFNFLVEKLNEKIQIEKIDLQNQNKNVRTFRKSIGILDIFGFQVLGINTLEQFFINFANQKLQQLYVSYIFKEEQNEFLKQGLKEFSHDIGFQDNKPIIDLFQLYPLGIFHLINQSSELNKSDEELPPSINRNHPKNAFVHLPISKKGLFQINHSCSPVTYNTSSFTAKNKDQFPKQILEIIETIKDKVMKDIITGKPEAQGVRSASKKFLGSKFMNEMNKLTEELYSCDCHFVRCIKPNSYKAPLVFNSAAVLQSLRYLGVLDSIIIRKLGYIYRRPFKQFHKKFYELDHYPYNYQSIVKDMSEEEFKEQSKKIVEKYVKQQIDQKNILFGVKKIMIKESTLNTIELLLKEKRRLRVTTANRFKRMYWNAIFRSKVKSNIRRIKILKAHILTIGQIIKNQIRVRKVNHLQIVIRKFLWHRRFEKIKEQATKSVTKISSYLKMKKQQKIYKSLRLKAIKLQGCCRAFICAGKFIRQKTCRSIIIGYLQNVWTIIQNKQATKIIKIWKGYKMRKMFRVQLDKIKKNIILKRIKTRFKRAIFVHNYLKFKQALQKYKKPILMLQRVVRKKYWWKVFRKVIKSVLIIQKAYRKHLAKKFYLNRLWDKYKSHIAIGEENKSRQLNQMGVKRIDTKIHILDQTVGIQCKLYPNQILNRYIKFKQSNLLNYQINETFGLAKNTLQAYIGDLDIMSDTYYNGGWLSKFIEAKQEMKLKGQYPIRINLCDGFTTIISSKDRVYCFEGQMEFQNTKNGLIKMESMGIARMVQTNKFSGYLLTYNKKMYVWGDNKSGQLLSQNKADFVNLQQCNLLKNVQQVAVKGDNILFIGKQGKVFKSEQKFGRQKIFQPKEIFDRVPVICISASYQFVHFLSNVGHIYSSGKNYYGQLGLGFASNKTVIIPQLNTYLKDKKQTIQSVSVGIGHTICKSKLGYVYGWGDNGFRQINSENIESYHTPIQIQIQRQKVKVLQAVAGSRASYFLTQNLKVIAHGTSSCFPSAGSVESFALQLLSETSLISRNLIPIKISTSWSQVLSILNINTIDSSKCKEGCKPDVVIKHCKAIAKQWISDELYPEYHEFMDNMLNISDMRKFKFNQEVKINKKNNDGNNELQQLQMLMQLRKTSQFFKMSARKKIQDSLIKLQNKPQDHWSQSDKQLNAYIRANCMKYLTE